MIEIPQRRVTLDWSDEMKAKAKEVIRNQATRVDEDVDVWAEALAARMIEDCRWCG